VVDLGAGDGRFVVELAARDPDTLAVAIDANAAGLADGVRRARRRRLENAVFVVASAERLPPELEGTADAVRIQFPWGSLLDGVLRGDDAVAGNIARIMKPRAELVVLVSVVERDGVAGIARLDEGSARDVGRRLAAAGGLTLMRTRPVTPADVAESRSTWAKRLGVGRNRPAWRLELRN
jgi:16S rRNA (adenine(1408)-N(1))-methyltransferase